jgi:serine protease Do
MKYFKLSIIGLFFLASLNGFSQNNPEAKRIEKLISDVVEKATATSVYIIEWDTLKNTVKQDLKESDGFSGVVVSAEGHILTVSHAAMVNEVYQVRFADGSKHIAKGLGRLGLQVNGTDHDMAMLKILKPGKWSYAKIGKIADLKINQPLISISYPGSFYKQMPNVRFGRLTDLDPGDGFLESTTKMEPGDSGGGLFDAEGRVVGLHSWIKETEDQNFDVPAEFYLKYWTGLNVPKDYKELPAADAIPAAIAVNAYEVPALAEVVSLSPKQQKSVFQITSVRGTQQVMILGTLFELGTTTCIVSKSSMVVNQPSLKMGERIIPLTVIARDRENDLVLLKTTEKLETAIKLKVAELAPDVLRKDLGKIFVSALSNEGKKLGILSSVYIDMPVDVSKGYVGANAVFAEGKVTFPRLGRGSNPLFKVKDQIVKINGVDISSAGDYDREMGKYLAGDAILLDLVREGNPIQVSVYLSGQPTVRHVSFEYPGGRSNRSDGFIHVMVQDAAIKADECGSPVFDVSGRFYGINIARRSRTSSIIMPVNTLAKFIRDGFKN